MRKTNQKFTEEIFRRSTKELEKIEKKKKGYLLAGKYIAACLIFCIILGCVPHFWNPEGGKPNRNPTEHGPGQDVDDSKDQGEDEYNEYFGDLEATNLMSGMVGQKPELHVQYTDPDFIQSQMNFSVSLLKESMAEKPGENTLISPLSVSMLLAMTANGANGTTKSEFCQLLAGERDLEKLNEWMYTYRRILPSDAKCKCSIANSIWFRDLKEFRVNETFLQTNANYYKASAYAAPFDDTTVKDINQWVKHHTEGMIPSILDDIDDTSMMYLLNAVCFDAKWASVFTKNDVKEEIFTSQDGQQCAVEMMHGFEYVYLEDDSVVGFAKNYSGSEYSFVALLPKESTSVDAYVSQLTGEQLQALLKNKQNAPVEITLPIFSYEYELQLKPVLQRMGLFEAFEAEKADFSGIGTGLDGKLYLGQVKHKTFIQVDCMGTRAAAVTMGDVESDALIVGGYQVKLDRPFVYMIVDNRTDLPIFIGTVTNL